MMGRKAEVQNKLFYEAINLDHRIRKDHFLRKIAQRIDFDFIYKEVRETYGNNGNVSVPPPMILKMMLLLVLYNVRSERERYLNKSYRILEERLGEEKDSSDDSTTKGGDANKKHISTTDPDASVVRRGHGRSKLQYQIHRGVDEKKEVITATEVTPGEVHESHCMDSLIDKHHENTGKRALLL